MTRGKWKEVEDMVAVCVLLPLALAAALVRFGLKWALVALIFWGVAKWAGLL